jgi:hypothetical protein
LFIHLDGRLGYVNFHEISVTRNCQLASLEYVIDSTDRFLSQLMVSTILNPSRLLMKMYPFNILPAFLLLVLVSADVST